jgi:hypothetical protein
VKEVQEPDEEMCFDFVESDRYKIKTPTLETSTDEFGKSKTLRSYEIVIPGMQ